MQFDSTYKHACKTGDHWRPGELPRIKLHDHCYCEFMLRASICLWFTPSEEISSPGIVATNIWCPRLLWPCTWGPRAVVVRSVHNCVHCWLCREMGQKRVKCEDCLEALLAQDKRPSETQCSLTNHKRFGELVDHLWADWGDCFKSSCSQQQYGAKKLCQSGLNSAVCSASKLIWKATIVICLTKPTWNGHHPSGQSRFCTRSCYTAIHLRHAARATAAEQLVDKYVCETLTKTVHFKN